MDEQKTLPTLPDEVCLKIFGELSKEDILNATLVSKEWNGLISNSSRILKDFRFVAKLSDKSLIDDINRGRFKITRNYRELVIKEDSRGTQKTYTKLLDIIKVSLGDNLISLELRNLYSKKLRLVDLIKLLSGCHVIESLVLVEVALYETGNKNLEPVKLQQLQKLMLDNTETAKILDFIECTKLETLFIYFEENASKHSVIKFLNRLDQLDSLTIFDFGLESKILLQPKFHWNKLDLRGNMLPPPSSPEYATAIANLEALGSASKEKSSITFSEIIAESPIMQIILNSCVNIKELTFDDTHVLSNISQLRQMKEIDKLMLNDNSGMNGDQEEYDEQRRSFIAIMEKMPNVKHLKLEGSDSIFMLGMELVPILFANVTLLEVYMTVLEEMQTYSFPNLTTLSVFNFNETKENIMVITTFCSANLNLKYLEVALVESRMESEVLMLKLYNELCDTSFENFKIRFAYSSCDWEKFRLIVSKTKEEIEVKHFARILTPNERLDYAM